MRGESHIVWARDRRGPKRAGVRRERNHRRAQQQEAYGQQTDPDRGQAASTRHNRAVFVVALGEGARSSTRRILLTAIQRTSLFGHIR
jgi:hypothetical protein